MIHSLVDTILDRPISAITTDTFIGFTSKRVCAARHGRAVLHARRRNQALLYLTVGLAAMLVFVGAKFSYSDLVGKVPVSVSLPVKAMIVGASIAASLLATRPNVPEGRT